MPNFASDGSGGNDHFEPGEAFGHRRLAEQQTHDFFHWFHLKPTSPPKATDLGGEWHAFRPTGSKFSALVELAVLTTADGEIDGCRLGVDRVFIDGRDGAFANDIGKSFLAWAAPRDASAELSTLIKRIGHPTTGSARVITRRPVEPPPDDRTGCAQVFFGAEIRAQAFSEPIQFAFQNVAGAMPDEIALVDVGLGRSPTRGAPAWLLIGAWPTKPTAWPAVTDK